MITVLLLAVTLPLSTVFAAEPDMRYGREKLGQMANGSNLQYVYDQLVTGCGEAKAEIKIDLSGRNIDTNSDLSVIYNMVYSDYPEYFWVNGAWNASIEQRGSSVTLTMKPTYTMTGSALSSAQSAYAAKVNALTQGLSGSDYDKAKTLHDRLIDTVAYMSTSNDQNAYGALVEGKAVCNGYARAYQHLMLKAGIPAWYVSGTSINPSTSTPIGHAWNLVKLDGQWYYTDVTWDDQGAKTFYAYFNITTQQLLEGHAIGAQYAHLVPNATATAANFYIKEGRVFASYDQAKLAALLKKDNYKTQIYVTGDVGSFMTSLDANLTSLAEDLGASGRYQISYNASFLGHAIILDVVVTQSQHTHKVQQTIAQVNASCLTNGTKAYYVCDCGLRFFDPGCTQQITSDSQLEIKANEHTPSDWKNDAANHWKECTQCGSEIANTRTPHSDENQDDRCDTCGYVLPAADTGGDVNTDNSEAGGENSNDNDGSTNDQNPEQNTGSSGAVDGDQNTDSTQSTESTDRKEPADTTQSTEAAGSTNPSDGFSSATDETTPSEGAGPQTPPDDGADMQVWVLIGGVITAVTAGIVITFILINKKKAT